MRELGILNCHLLPSVGGPLSAITPQSITAYKHKRLAAKYSPSTLHKELVKLKQILTLAYRRKFIVQNPFVDVKILREAPPRSRYLQPQEWLRLIHVIPQQYRLPIEFLLLTGARRSEMLHLTWTDLDLRNGIAQVGKDKRGKLKHLFLSPPLVILLEQLPRIENQPRVFWNIDADYLSQCVRKASKAAGVADFHLHDLRHTVGSWLAIFGANVKLIAEILAHSDLRTTNRYLTLPQAATRGALSDFTMLFPVTEISSENWSDYAI